MTARTLNLLRTISLIVVPAISWAQTVVENPTATQTITQPIATSLNVNRIENIRMVDQFGSIQAAVNDTPAGGTVIVPPGYIETLTQDLTLNKSIVIWFAGSATIHQSGHQVIIPAGTSAVSIISNFPLNGNSATNTVLFDGYTGSGAAFQIGGPSAFTSNIYLRGIRIDISNAPSGAQGINLTRTYQYWLEGTGVNADINCGSGCSSGTSLVGILIDGVGTDQTLFSGIGEINFPIINIGSGLGGSANSVAIRGKNVATHTLIIGGHIQMAGSGTACFDVAGNTVNASELTFYSPNCEAASTALTVEGPAHAVGDIRIDSGVTTLANFGTGTATNKIRFVDAVGGTVVDNGTTNSVEFPAMNQVHGDIWQIFANNSFWGVNHIPTNKPRFFFNSVNTFINGEGGGGILFNNGGGNGVYFYNGATTQVASIDSAGGATFTQGTINGNLYVNGAIYKGADYFKIDHPLDPANKYLAHSVVESPDMKNIYDGLATMDDNGEAEISFPDWFGALNKEFRYQLTCIGGSAPVYVSQEIKNNRFRIAGGTPGLKVSWQVTGVRHDAFANAHRTPVEEAKPEKERGHYLFPPPLSSSRKKDDVAKQ